MHLPSLTHLQSSLQSTESTKKGVYEREIRRTANAVRESNRAVHDSKLTIYVD